MGSLEELAKSLSNTPTKVFIPEVGHRVVTKTSEGKVLDSGGKDITSSFSPPLEELKKEFVEDSQRKDAAEIAESESVSPIRAVNLGLYSTATTLKSFRDLKQTLLDDINTDPATMKNLENIEQYLTQLQQQYFTRKEELRNQFK